MTAVAKPTDLTTHSQSGPTAQRLRTDATYQAFWLMRVGFTLVPILFGADKFAHVMVNWDKYLAPELQHWLSPFGTVHQSMFAVGVIEIVAGIAVLLLPRVGGYIVALWLAGIIVNLALIGGYWDIMMRDVALFLLAVTFTRLASAFPAGAISARLLANRRRREIQP